ncbi:MAG: SDR family NAD(P)-dependent oxidoreductase [Ilumatobacteraceae bacterium]
MDEDYQGKIALVTGAGSGIGRCITNELAARGATVVATDYDADTAAETAAANGDSVTSGQLDVTDPAAFAAAVGAAVDDHGRIDLVFNNAGIGGVPSEARFLEAKHWDHVIDVNVRGVINGVSAAYPTMIEQGDGHIVNTASMAGLAPVPGATPYSATKHAVVGLSLSLRAEASSYGVRVSALCPAALETPILDIRPEPELEAEPGYWIPDLRRYLGRVGGVADPADFAQYALDQVAKNKGTIVFGRTARVIARLYRAMPGAVAAMSTREFERERKRIVDG